MQITHFSLPTKHRKELRILEHIIATFLLFTSLFYSLKLNSDRWVTFSPPHVYPLEKPFLFPPLQQQEDIQQHFSTFILPKYIQKVKEEDFWIKEGEKKIKEREREIEEKENDKNTTRRREISAMIVNPFGEFEYMKESFEENKVIGKLLQREGNVYQAMNQEDLSTNLTFFY